MIELTLMNLQMVYKSQGSVWHWLMRLDYDMNYLYWLKWIGMVYKLSSADIFQDRLYKKTTVPCLEIISFRWEFRNYRYYITCIWQVGGLLRYDGLQVLEVFKNALQSRLYLVLFPIKDLRKAIKKAKRILTKEETDRQLAGQ